VLRQPDESTRLCAARLAAGVGRLSTFVQRMLEMHAPRSHSATLRRDMCGICGCVGTADEQAVLAMTRLMRHRGPDGEGVRCFPSVDGSVPTALGHRRLSIIDPTPRGAQPMSYADGRYWITYNGELYNFKQLRQDLERDGFAFVTETDTEVLLAMYARYEAEMLDRLNGIFAFAIWDTHRQALFMARDRLGVKPLYYSNSNGVLAFASEVKALLPIIGRPRLNMPALSEYLTFLWVPDPTTLFEGVMKLAPGHCATYDRGGLTIRQWWDMRFAPEDGREEDWASATRETVQSAVRRQMVSDVPLGSFLSGGLDSSAIVAEMAAAAGTVSTYTIGFTAKDLKYDVVPDDVRYSREIAKAFPVDYHERIVEPEVAELLPRLIWHMDEPIADPAAISTYLVCAAAREELTVILSGMGGDEIFAGYPRHLAARLARTLNLLPVGMRRQAREQVERHLTVGRPGSLRAHRRNLLKFVRGLEGSTQERYLIHSSYYQAAELRDLLSGDGRAIASDPFARHHQYLEKVTGEDWLNQLLYVDLKTFLPCLNLAYTDKMSMAASTEVRVPLLDDEVVALSARIPPSLKLRGTTRKYIFKRAMEGVLPKSVIWRPKAGFTAPVRAWLVGSLRPSVAELLSPASVRARGLFEPQAVQRLLAENERDEADHALRIWALLTLELWQRTFIDGDGTAPLDSLPGASTPVRVS
jgi:asparagine synthase (glutamine-hydrolysing)